MMLDDLPMYASAAFNDTAGFGFGLRATMTDDEIQAAAHAAFALGAGWGGFSVVGPPDSNTGYTIDSQGNISNMGQPTGAHAQFANGQDLAAAAGKFFGLGREDNANAPTTTPPDEGSGLTGGEESF